jgi:mRNA interferase RelE/StbE
MAYAITITSAADRAVKQLPKEVRARITQRLIALSHDPRGPGSVKLAGQDAYRVRVGDYRIIYSILDDQLIVLVIDVGHRRDVYRRR